MRLPTALNIGGFDWTIEYSNDIATQGQVFGSTHYRSFKIFIDPQAPVQKQEQTLLHEIMHICVWQCGLERRFENKEVVTEEDVVHSLSMALYPALKKLGYLEGIYAEWAPYLKR